MSHTGTFTITTAYRGATDTTGSRIVARGHGRQASIGYPYELSQRDAHIAAAIRLTGRILAGMDIPLAAHASLTPAIVGDRPTGYVVRVDWTVPDASEVY